MFIAKNNDLIILAENTREELEAKLKFMVWTSIEETEETYVLYEGSYLTEDEVVAMREEKFNKDFFNTSLGYIRRKVSMATGEIKDFLSDLLPTISIGVQTGQDITIIAYNKPDFTEEVIDWTKYQKLVVANAQFINDCFVQLKNDFKPTTPVAETPEA